MFSPILVTGIPRSGTSVIAQVLCECGAFVGNVTKMQENIEILHTEQELYNSLGGDPNAQFPILDTENLSIPNNWRTKIIKILSNQGYNDSVPWMYKSHLITLLWPVWRQAFPYAKWVIVRRKPTEIIQSCRLTGYMKAFKNPENVEEIGGRTEEDGWKWMVSRYEQEFVKLINSGADVKVVWPHRIVYGDYSQLIELVNWAGLKWRPDILPVIDFKFLKVRRRNGIG